MKPSITHHYDVWHVVKGLIKKLESLGKQRDCKVVQEWTKSILNHLYWSAASSTTGEEAVAKWVSVANHIQNVHEHENWLFPACLPGDVSDRNWFQPSTKACEKLTDIIIRKQLLADIASLSPNYQTSSVEGFHSLILKFAPKNLIFSYKSMLCRLYLAALHFNENSDRGHRVDAAYMPSVLWCCWLGSRKGILPVKMEWWGAGMVICLERGVNHMHMVQLMSLPPHHLLLY